MCDQERKKKEVKEKRYQVKMDRLAKCDEGNKKMENKATSMQKVHIYITVADHQLMIGSYKFMHKKNVRHSFYAWLYVLPSKLKHSLSFIGKANYVIGASLWKSMWSRSKKRERE